MSKITTLSTFYYGYIVTKDNNVINFSEGGPELTATLSINDYTATEYCKEIQTRMRLAGSLNYVCTFDRNTRRITISAPSNFSLLTATGSQQAVAIWDMAGFTIATDKVGSNSYTGENPSGDEYRTQMTLTDYLSPEDNLVKESAAVNISANGIVQVLEFGNGRRMECTIRGVTNKINTGNVKFYENPNGIDDFRKFMRFLVTKSKLEFMPDVDNRSNFYSLLLEATDSNQRGTSFEIKNMKGASDYFQCGPLVFREVIE
jgi:hypothetical protein